MYVQFAGQQKFFIINNFFFSIFSFLSLSFLQASVFVSYRFKLLTLAAIAQVAL